MPCHTTERLIVVTPHPHRVLHRGERKCVFGRSGSRYPDRRVDRFRRVDLGRGHEQRPVLDRRGCGERGEVADEAVATPSARERHHPDRIETLADEVAVGVDGIGADAEQFGDLRADGTWAANDGSPDPISYHTDPPTS